MGVIIKFFLFFLVTYLILRSIGRLLFGIRYKQNSFRHGTPRGRQPRRESPKQPETQQDRIIGYQKKNFESTEVEDAEFVEIKEK
ncbi:MAG: hypothetical protein QM237_00220 [Bacteroidota bacterium]|jgi:hypothetical protein|nr:hypothetical protein [Bacteroidota bacterium]HHU96910.1 hypothetical protein [Petrimonas sp.]